MPQTPTGSHGQNVPSAWLYGSTFHRTPHTPQSSHSTAPGVKGAATMTIRLRMWLSISHAYSGLVESMVCKPYQLLVGMIQVEMLHFAVCGVVGAENGGKHINLLGTPFLPTCGNLHSAHLCTRLSCPCHSQQTGGSRCPRNPDVHAPPPS